MKISFHIGIYKILFYFIFSKIFNRGTAISVMLCDIFTNVNYTFNVSSYCCKAVLNMACVEAHSPSKCAVLTVHPMAQCKSKM